jgi:hypothetical protein
MRDQTAARLHVMLSKVGAVEAAVAGEFLVNHEAQGNRVQSNTAML